MKTKKSLALMTSFRNPDLAKKFQESANKKVYIDDFIKDFLSQFISPDTKTAYIRDLKNFFDFLRSGDVVITHPDQILAFHFQAYRDEMMAGGYASATINRRLVSIRSFLKWSMAANLITFNPLDMVKLPKVQTESPTVAFDDKEVVKMIQCPDEFTHRGRTHRLAIVLLFNLGLRRSELINAKMGDIFEDRGHVVMSIRGKGDKVRLMPLNNYVQKEIEKYIVALAKVNVVLLSDDYILQTSDQGRKNKIPMDGSTVYRIINRYANRLGIKKSVSPHSCRATVISHLLDTQNKSIRDVATFAGHANINTTERYDKRRDNLDKSAAYDVSYDEEEDKGA